MNAPMVPIQREAVQRDYINRVEHAVAAQQLYKVGVDRRKTAQHDGQVRIDLSYRLRRQHDHSCEDFPIWIDVKIPVRKIVRLIPKHYGFDHAPRLCLQWCSSVTTFLQARDRANICRHGLLRRESKSRSPVRGEPQSPALSCAA